MKNRYLRARYHGWVMAGTVPQIYMDENGRWWAYWENPPTIARVKQDGKISFFMETGEKARLRIKKMRKISLADVE